MTSRARLREIGQLFMLSYDGVEPPQEVREYFRRFNIGGVILFADNYENPQQLRDACRLIQREMRGEGAPRVLIATDHEGGRVQRFRGGFTRLPPMAALSGGHPHETRRQIAAAARELAAAGIDFNLAPVVDLVSADAPGAIGDRAFSEDPEVASRHVAAAVRGLADGGVLSCAKHFPGHGATSTDSHHSLPSIDATYDALDQRDLTPFRAAIAAGVDAVMTAHVVYPNAGDAELPASLSPFWLSEALRNRLGFSGLAISDALEMRAIRNSWSPAEAGLQALQAGSDMLIFYLLEEQFQAVQSIRAAISKGEIPAARIEAALSRVRASKQRSSVLRARVAS